MAAEDWNWRLPADAQDYPWDCAACSTAWALRTIGFDLSEQDVIAGLGPARISPTYGLLDASGAALVSYLQELGVNAANNPSATWTDVTGGAGYGPMVIGGRQWNHWCGVRIWGRYGGYPGPDSLAIMNPSPGWMGVAQTLDQEQFNQLGSFSAVWFVSW